MLDLQRDLINSTGKREYNSEELAKTEKYIYLENETIDYYNLVEISK